MVLQYNAGEWVAASFYKALWRFISSECFFVYIACGPPANHSAKGLAFPRMAKVVSWMVWRFRAWRKLFPERFGVSTLGESHFPNGLAFPRLAKVISQVVWSFRAWRKLFPEWFSVSAYGESRFPNGLVFSRMAKVFSRIVLCLRGSRKLLFKRFGACGPPANHFLKVLCLRASRQSLF